MLIGLQNCTFEFGSRLIFEDATWHLNPGERIGLVGLNGTGKSTLFKVLVGEYLPAKGSVEKSKETTIGYIHQDLMNFSTQQTIMELAFSAFEEIQAKEKELKEVEKLLETDYENEPVLLKYADILHDLQTLDAYNIHYKVEEVLQGLGFKETDLNRPYEEFSGGWRMRVILAKMILQAPDVLLLDEPTNHLDLPSIEWLEKYLLNYKGSVVIISHDKFFLNKMVNKIVEIYQQKLHFYNGNFDYFVEEKKIRIDLAQKAFENQQDYIRQQERFIERFKAKASKASQAQSVQKRLDRLDKLADTSLELPNLKINFSVDKTPGKIIYELTDISKQFNQNIILKDAVGMIERGDKIALIGANGKGKSTLLRIIGGNENFDGNCKKGHNVEEGFYAQHQLEILNIENDILTEMQECGSAKGDVELRTILGCFLFSGDDVEKKIKVLSGGEKARVALAKVMISKANFLILDEPTNHLDMHSVEILANALNSYTGTYILVSHDRYFISKTANKIWEIIDNKIVEFKGPYQEWVEWNERMAKQ
ncbi:MAG: ABC-F family ATP-binding cassette domain-containing protein, partial [Sediminibacterium sp.]|nr:ABC-F family ATP-binding cassette domain-containing protein [Sediminibacterium sp.]